MAVTDISAQRTKRNPKDIPWILLPEPTPVKSEYRKLAFYQIGDFSRLTFARFPFRWTHSHRRNPSYSWPL